MFRITFIFIKEVKKRGWECNSVVEPMGEELGLTPSTKERKKKRRKENEKNE